MRIKVQLSVTGRVRLFISGIRDAKIFNSPEEASYFIRSFLSKQPNPGQWEIYRNDPVVG